jgi:hypothetical protein
MTTGDSPWRMVGLAGALAASGLLALVVGGAAVGAATTAPCPDTEVAP